MFLLALISPKSRRICSLTQSAKWSCFLFLLHQHKHNYVYELSTHSTIYIILSRLTYYYRHSFSLSLFRNTNTYSQDAEHRCWCFGDKSIRPKQRRSETRHWILCKLVLSGVKYAEIILVFDAAAEPLFTSGCLL